MSDVSGSITPDNVTLAVFEKTVPGVAGVVTVMVNWALAPLANDAAVQVTVPPDSPHPAAETLGALPVGKQIGTHTLRHSYARHLLANGIPINRLSRWLGHANLQTTFIYLEVLPDPLGDIHRVPYWETITAFVEVNGVYPEIVAANVGKRNRV